MCEILDYKYILDWIASISPALIGGIIGATLTHLFVLYRDNEKKNEDLKIKETLIESDLKYKLTILPQLSHAYNILDERIKTHQDLDYPNDIFHDLHTEVYHSISNPDLFQIFKEDFFILVNVYKAINHLKDYSPYRIKIDFIKPIDAYTEKHKEDFDKEKFKKYITPYLEAACEQIDMNRVTIEDLHKEIEFLLENIKKPNGRAKNPMRKILEIRRTFLDI